MLEDWAADDAPWCLSATYVPEEGTNGGKLAVTAQYEHFAGRGEAYFAQEDLLTFAERIQAFPLEEHEVVGCASGLFVGYEHVALEVAPRGGKGQLIVSVRLAKSRWRNGTPVIEHRLSCELPTSYEYLGRFGRQLSSVVLGVSAEANLCPDVLV